MNSLLFRDVGDIEEEIAAAEKHFNVCTMRSSGQTTYNLSKDEGGLMTKKYCVLNSTDELAFISKYGFVSVISVRDLGANYTLIDTLHYAKEIASAANSKYTALFAVYEVEITETIKLGERVG